MNDIFLNFKILMSFWDIIRGRDFILGEAVRNFEKRLAHFLDAPYVLGVNSGTDALILSLKALGIGPGDEVIVPAAGFFSTVGAVSWVNARPVFVDADLNDFNLDPNLIENVVTKKTKAIIVAHLNGRMADTDKILAISKKHNLFLIEDAAQAIGAKYKGQSIGYYSDIACLSFNPSKILAAYGDGGAIITKSAALAEKISLMRMYGAGSYNDLSVRHSILGVSSRLSSFQAAVLNAKLEGLGDVIEKWRRNYFLYAKFLRNVQGIILPKNSLESDCFINGYRYIILTKKRNELLKFLRENKIDARKHYGVSLPQFEAFKHLGYKKGNFPIAERIAEESLALPTDGNIPEKEIRRTAELIRKFIEQTK